MKKEIINNRKLVNGFTRAYFRAYNYWYNNPDLAYLKVRKYYILNKAETSDYMKKIILLSLEDNYGLMMSQVGVDSLYGNLKLAQAFDYNTKNYAPMSLENLIFQIQLRLLNVSSQIINLYEFNTIINNCFYLNIIYSFVYLS